MEMRRRARARDRARPVSRTCSAGTPAPSRPIHGSRGAARAIARGFDQAVPTAERLFFYLPFEHSENLADQERCVALNRASGDADTAKWAEHHADSSPLRPLPHRNKALGRATTAEEQAFLDGGGFAG